MIAILTDPAGGTKQLELPTALPELRFPLFRPIAAYWNEPDMSVAPTTRVDVYRLVRPIEPADGALVFYEWVRTE